MGTFKRIGVFDSGLGGLTVLRELRNKLPHLDYIYLGDTARVPYGTRSVKIIGRYAEDCIRFLKSFDVSRIVIACNTVSAVALEHVKDLAKLPVYATIDVTAREALKTSVSKQIGVIGTKATIKSGAYERALRDLDPNCRVYSKACPLFVPLVEEGLFEGALVERTIEHYLGELKHEQIDALILGCTHYPLLEKSLDKFFGFKLKLISSARCIASELYSEYQEENERNQSQATGSLSIFLTDDSPDFKLFATNILGKLEGVTCNIISLEE
ncbi:MAG: glutamate racemase [SAR324 cluster bacterium]|uniref:Glutamate racemase n=1 Tax=SAR324 cluster bacterium TaxID=2024889 RepID=A0A7X9FQA8_9DELT|nr:glutamate racemase [SAR324 cluster bacterium]